MKLPHLSIATKLYAIFALLATVTAGACRGGGVQRASPCGADRRIRGGLCGGAERRARQWADLRRRDGVARHLHVARHRDRARSMATACSGSTTASARSSKDWRSAVRAEDAALFEAFALRFEQFQDFRRELVRRGIEIGPAAGPRVGRQRRQPHRSARRSTTISRRSADHYAKRAQRIYAAIDDGIDRTAWLISGRGRRRDRCSRCSAPS